jgi:hypothetical protein
MLLSEGFLIIFSSFVLYFQFFSFLQIVEQENLNKFEDLFNMEICFLGNFCGEFLFQVG